MSSTICVWFQNCALKPTTEVVSNSDAFHVPLTQNLVTDRRLDVMYCVFERNSLGCDGHDHNHFADTLITTHSPRYYYRSLCFNLNLYKPFNIQHTHLSMPATIRRVCIRWR